MQEEQIYTAIKKEGQIEFYELKRSVSIPIKSLAPEYVLYQEKTIRVLEQEYNLKSVAMNKKVIHFLHGNIIFNHMAPIDELGMISPAVQIGTRQVEGGETEFFYESGVVEGELVDNIDLMLQAVMCFELVNGELSRTYFIYENGDSVNLYNVRNGEVCTGRMPETDNPSRLLATIMQNKGNLDHSACTRAFNIEEHPKHKEYWTPKGLIPGPKTDISSIWMEIK